MGYLPFTFATKISQPNVDKSPSPMDPIRELSTSFAIVRLRLTSTKTCWALCPLSEDHPWSNYHEVIHGGETEPARPGRFQTK